MPDAPALPRKRSSRRIFGGILVLAVAGGVFADWYRAYPVDTPRTYVGRQTCAECHNQELALWTGSHHDAAMDLATDATVLADFNDTEFTHAGVTTRFFRRNGKFFANAEGPDDGLHDYEVKYTFGVAPLQQYMVEFPDGRVQVLRVSWDTDRREWFYEGPPDVPDDERIPPDDPLHWTGIAHNWNSTCAECHSTNLEKNYDPASNTYATRWSEIDVSCESCHGPASLHIELASSRSLFWDRVHGYGLAKFKGDDTRPQLETCAKCHSRRHTIADGFRPGDAFADHYQLALLEPGLYHADGQIRDEVYVYGSFLQSKMHAEGVRCTDCHNPHSLELKFTGNQLCSQCHLPGIYDSATHHHHKPNTPGSECVDCHMTSETYMVVDPRRDHSFRVPRPDLTVDLGTPNACNGCHTKPTEDAAWADDKIHQWRGKERDAPRHFAYAIHAAETGQPGAAEQLAEVLRNPREPAIVRATAAVLLGRVGDGTVTSAQRAALRDVNPLVRAAAVESLPAMSPLDVESLLAARLGDTSRSVRVVAAAQMLRHMSAGGTTAESLPNSARANWETALGEYRDAQELVLDQGAGNINLAEMNLMLNRPQEALQLYGRAVEIAPYLAGPRDRLAMLLGDNPAYADQVRTLREEEVKLLTRNCELLPGAADPRYNLGRMHYLLGNLDASQAAMDEACRLAPESYDIRWFTTLLLEHRAKLQPTAAAWDAAIESAGALDVIRPGDAVARQLLQNFAARRRAVGGP